MNKEAAQDFTRLTRHNGDILGDAICEAANNARHVGAVAEAVLGVAVSEGGEAFRHTRTCDATLPILSLSCKDFGLGGYPGCPGLSLGTTHMAGVSFLNSTPHTQRSDGEVVSACPYGGSDSQWATTLALGHQLAPNPAPQALFYGSIPSM